MIEMNKWGLIQDQNQHQIQDQIQDQNLNQNQNLNKKLEEIFIKGILVKKGSQVKIHLTKTSDIFDLFLNGMTAQVDSIEQDLEDKIYLAVTMDEDPGRDLGSLGQPGHRFFFDPSEVEPL